MAKVPCTGLTASRNNTTMTFSWKLPVGGTKKKGSFRYKLITGNAVASKVKWTTVKLTGATLMPTSTTITLDPTLYYPNTSLTLNSIIWDVMMEGQTWAGDQTYNFVLPGAPDLSRSGDTFSWSTYQDSSSNNIYFQDVEYQSTNSGSPTDPDWSASSVTSGTGSSSGSQTYSGDNSGYRHFRCRVRGVAGASPWVYEVNSHAVPNKAYAITGTFNALSSTVRTQFMIPEADELNEIKVYYAIDTPTAQYECPVGASWVLGATVPVSYNLYDNDILEPTGPHDSIYSAAFTVPSLAVDKAIWVKIETINGSQTTMSDIVRVENGTLAAPTISGFSVNTSLKQITVTFANNSSVSGVKIACQMSYGNKIIGEVAGTATTITCSYGNADITEANFSLFAFWGTATNPVAKSSLVTQAIDLTKPQPPTAVTVAKTKDSGKVQVKWTNNWSNANAVQITWSDDPDAWDSNLQPNEFMVENTATTAFLIAGLALGKIWYFRLRAVHLSEDGLEPDVYGPWCASLVAVDLTETPDAPAVWVDESAIAPGDAVTVHWAYVSNDDTNQAKATIYIDNTATYTVNSAVQSYTFIPSWANNTTHTIKVKTLSESGKESAQSSAVSVKVAPALSLTVSTSLVSNELRAMPLTVTATGAGTGGKTMVSIVRDGNYSAGRPDDDKSDGFDGETIYTRTFSGPISSQAINLADLVGRLDDGCYYKLVVTIASSIGQTARSVIRFKVAWTHQPEIPTGTVTALTGGVAQITVDQPSNYASGDYCQIYRLSKDKPELIIDDGAYATAYVDPYPASGGGYRIVNVSKNGDYLGANYPAWIDKAHSIETDELIVDFDEQQVRLPYNIKLSSTWKKDFERTTYLNGSVKGDWNRGTTMDASIGTVTLRTDDDRIGLMRALAAYPGVCHVRTPDGASYAADVQVKQSGEYSTGLASFDLTIQKVDPQGNEGYLKTDWEDMQG